MLKMNRLSIAVMLAIGLISIACLAGCGGGGGDVANSPIAGVPTGGRIVLDNPSETLSFADASALPRGHQLALRINRSGYQVREFPCTLISSFTDSGQRLVECQIPAIPNGPTVGNGDSGSPVLYDGKVIGALAYGYSGNSRDFFVHSIEDMLQANSYTSTASSSSRRSPIGLALQVNASDRAVAFMRGIGQGNDQFVITRSVVGTRGGNPEPAEAIAGQSVAVNYVGGPIVNGSAVGALTFQLPDGRWLAFGHPMDFYGSRNVPVSLAYMDQMIDTTFGSFKQAHATKEPLGALVQDRNEGCVIDPSICPVTTPIIVKATVGERTSTYRHELLRDNGSPAETYFAGLTIFSSLDAALRQIARMGAEGTVSVKFEGSDARTFTISTPESYSAGGTAPRPYDAAGEVTRSVMSHVYDMSEGNFQKSLESVTIEVTFHDWQAPVEDENG